MSAYTEKEESGGNKKKITMLSNNDAWFERPMTTDNVMEKQ